MQSEELDSTPPEIDRILDGRGSSAVTKGFCLLALGWLAVVIGSIATVVALKRQGREPHFRFGESNQAMPVARLGKAVFPELRLREGSRPFRAEEPDTLSSLLRVDPQGGERRRAVAQMERLFPDQRHLAEFMAYGMIQAERCCMWEERSLIRDQMSQYNKEVGLWYAWRLLNEPPGVREEDLFRLRELIRECVPNEKERSQLLEWASERRRKRGAHAWGSLLPDTEWTLYWVLYTEWCAPNRIHEARKREFIEAFGGPERFGGDTWEMLVRWGASLAKEQELSSPGRYPRIDERAAIAAVTDVVLGYSKPAYLTGAGFLLGYPDETPLLSHMSEREMKSPRVFSYPETQVDWIGVVAASFALCIAAMIVLVGIETMTQGYLPYRLGLGRNDSYREWVRENGENVGITVIVGFVSLAPAFFLIRHYISPEVGLCLNSRLLLFIGVVWASIMGSLIARVIDNLITVLFFWMGVDPRRTFVDNLLSAGLSFWLLSLIVDQYQVILTMLAIGISKGVTTKALFHFRRHAR